MQTTVQIQTTAQILPAAETTGECVEHYPLSDIPGHDLWWGSPADEAACWAECTFRPSCTAAGWDPVANDKCYVKAAPAGSTVSDSARSLTVRCGIVLSPQLPNTTLQPHTPLSATPLHAHSPHSTTPLHGHTPHQTTPLDDPSRHSTTSITSQTPQATPPVDVRSSGKAEATSELGSAQDSTTAEAKTSADTPPTDEATATVTNAQVATTPTSDSATSDQAQSSPTSITETYLNVTTTNLIDTSSPSEETTQNIDITTAQPEATKQTASTSAPSVDSSPPAMETLAQKLTTGTEQRWTTMQDAPASDNADTTPTLEAATVSNGSNEQLVTSTVDEATASEQALTSESDWTSASEMTSLRGKQTSTEASVDITTGTIKRTSDLNEGSNSTSASQTDTEVSTKEPGGKMLTTTVVPEPPAETSSESAGENDSSNVTRSSIADDRSSTTPSLDRNIASPGSSTTREIVFSANQEQPSTSSDGLQRGVQTTLTDGNGKETPDSSTSVVRAKSIESSTSTTQSVINVLTTTLPDKPSETNAIKVAISEFSDTEQSDVPDKVIEDLLDGNSSSLKDFIASLPEKPTKSEYEELIDTIKDRIPDSVVRDLEKLQEAAPDDDRAVSTTKSSPLSKSTVRQELKEAIGIFARLNSSQVPEEVVDGVLAGDASALEDLAGEPTKADYQRLIDSVAKFLPEEAVEELEKLREKAPIGLAAPTTTLNHEIVIQLKRALEKFAGLNESEVPDSLVETLIAGDASELEQLIADLDSQPTKDDYADLLVSVGAALPAETTERLEELQKDAPSAAETATTATTDPTKAAEIIAAIANFAKVNESQIPDAVVAQLLNGDASGLEGIVASLPREPSKEDFDALSRALAPLLPSAALQSLDELEKTIAPLDKATMDALEAYAGRPIPADVLRALDEGDERKVGAWLDQLEPRPDSAALVRLQASADVPKAMKDFISQWAEPPLQPSEARSALAQLSQVLPIPIPDQVARRIAAGDASALTEWMAQVPLLPTEQEWRAMDVAGQPRALANELEAYKRSQADLWELGKLVKRMPLQLPGNLTGPLLRRQDTGPLLAWMAAGDVKPKEEDWELFEARQDVSATVQADLAAYKVASCQGPFAGDWGPWSACPVTCGRGNKTRSRERTQPDCAEVQTLFCNLPFCAVDCRWGEWGEWGSCSASCANGTALRYRKHDLDASELGQPCQGPNQETRECRGDTCQEPTVPPETAENLAKAGIESEVAEEPAAFSAAATDTIPFYIASLPVEEKMKLGHTLDATVALCSYDGVRCGREDFSAFYDESLGNCFTFNHHSPAKYHTQRPGAQSGLALLLQSEQDDYLCTTQLGGFKLMVHNQTERPFADTEGFNVAPGKTTSVSLSQLELSKQPPPYGDCTAGKSEGFLYTGTHTLEGCLRSCYQRRLVELCGCGDPRFLLPDNATACGLEKKLCLDFYRNCREGEGNPMACEQCTNPCESYHFLLTTSTSEMIDSEILSNVCAVNLEDSMDGSCQSKASKKRNFALVKIYYERLNLIRHREVQDYQMTNVISDFAGVLGITMGASVVTMLEFLYALADLLLHGLSRGRLSALS